MAENIGEQLHIKVQAFKKWAEINYPDITEDNDSGEWCFGREFDEMHSAAVEMIRSCPVSAASEENISDLLYAVARDSESEIIADVLDDHDGWFALLCGKCLSYPYTNAKWQFAKRLKDHSGGELKDLIYDFLSAGDEYTERMALDSLAYICPGQAERYALRFWDRNIYEHDEYQKITVLHVLYQTGSGHLEEYLTKAESSDSVYLKKNAEAIREKIRADGGMTAAAAAE